ncbi:N-acetyl sugar amidotransferase [Legionella cardiaca]|uniref:N-acetyl sugar amidotransferase n=1 Tax=Legionella cardiaca TaxID=1071983 RepID=A0ABY8AN74_9GAMM|nr:N-acetyl sugar amidotransferase [Legionella cardiaca]WED41909.1 N-acetyl sugar amidotransferase [Legionella cardiaca]
MIIYPGKVNLDKYKLDTSFKEAFYGLPSEVAFCAKCTYSNQKPNSEKEYKHTIDVKKPTINFDAEGVCSACRIAEKKKNIDWEQRKAQLKELCDRYRSKTGHYDCLIPGSGGKDSFYTAYILKYEYGMNPLTVTWAPHIYTSWGWNNFQAWIHAGFDNYLFTPNGQVHRLLTRLALENLYHPFQPFILGQMYFPPKLAADLNIPLVFYGENPAEYGNNAKEDDKATKDLAYFSTKNTAEIYLSGISALELKEDFGLTEVELQPYIPPDPDKLAEKKIEVQYLGYYLPWHPQECYYFAVNNGGFTPSPERTAGTYSKYSGIDDKIDDLHYYTTFIKFGIGRATYDSSQEIRNGELIREEGVALVNRFDGEYPARFEKENFDYLSIDKSKLPIAAKQFEQTKMDKEYFDRLTDNFRSPHLWAYDNGQWVLRYRVS